MKKILFAALTMLALSFAQQHLYAQFTFTADLQPIFRDNVNSFTIGLTDTVNVKFSVVNHGPDNIDTGNYIYYGITGLSPNWFLLIQDENGSPVFLDNSDTVDDSGGINFTNSGTWERDTTVQLCFFMKNNSWPDSFIYDPNPTNDTLCFNVTYKKKNDGPSSISRAEAEATLLKIAPNPAIDFVNIPLKDFRQGEAVLSVYSIDGRLAHKQTLPAGHDNTLKLDVHAWPKGIYVVDIRSDALKKNGRFVVQ